MNFSRTIESRDFDFSILKPLLRAALEPKAPDEELWSRVYDILNFTPSTPPPSLLGFQQTPYRFSSSTIPNSSEYLKQLEPVITQELHSVFVGVKDFDQTYFGSIIDLDQASCKIFEECKEGREPLFTDGSGWRDWPSITDETRVTDCLKPLFTDLTSRADEYDSPVERPRRVVIIKPKTSIEGSVSSRCVDLAIVNLREAGAPSKLRWSDIIVFGELKHTAALDIRTSAWTSLAKYAREIFRAQESRRFVLAFSICGSAMRAWAFDRLGGVASTSFDINKDGQRFVYMFLGFLWLDNEGLGFDPTIQNDNGTRYVDVKHGGNKERIIIDGVIRSACCISGRGTVCWKAHRDTEPSTTLVIKDSWQFPERDEEGDILRDVTAKGVSNIVRYYHHYTVKVRGTIDDIQSNVRRGIDVTTATNYKEATQARGKVDAISRWSSARSDRSSRRPSYTNSSTSLESGAQVCVQLNRIHRRVILHDYGKPIYKAKSPEALLRAIDGCLVGHHNLYEAGFLHRDISVNNLIINEDAGHSSPYSFLIDVDLATRVGRQQASGAEAITGTRAFMAIGALLGKPHLYVHDLESFFWVLLWICVHYNGPGSINGRVVEEFDKWNYEKPLQVAMMKTGILDEEMFLPMMKEHVSPYYQAFIPLLHQLKKLLFKSGVANNDAILYSGMRALIQDHLAEMM